VTDALRALPAPPLTLREVAEHLSCSVRTVEREIGAGRLPIIRVRAVSKSSSRRYSSIRRAIEGSTGKSRRLRRTNHSSSAGSGEPARRAATAFAAENWRCQWPTMALSSRPGHCELARISETVPLSRTGRKQSPVSQA